MKLISVNVGMPRPAPHEGRVVSTGIFKEPVAGPVFLRRLNLDGDGQADLRVHGGGRTILPGAKLDRRRRARAA
jgi:MOSC domain-containing protein YiiM